MVTEMTRTGQDGRKEDGLGWLVTRGTGRDDRQGGGRAGIDINTEDKLK